MSLGFPSRIFPLCRGFLCWVFPWGMWAISLNLLNLLPPALVVVFFVVEKVVGVCSRPYRNLIECVHGKVHVVHRKVHVPGALAAQPGLCS